MKLKLSIAASLLAATSMTFGYTTSTTNLTAFSPVILPVVDNTGTLIGAGTGSVGVGYFGTLSDAQIATSDYATLIADFVQFGTTDTFGTASAPGVDGIFTFSTDEAIPNNAGAGNNFTGQNIYTLMGEAGTLGGSSLLAVWKSDTLFGLEDLAGNGSAASNIAVGSGAPIIGNITAGSNLGPSAGGLVTTNSLQLVVAIPEPSSALLLGLGGLGLLIRRKR